MSLNMADFKWASVKDLRWPSTLISFRNIIATFRKILTSFRRILMTQLPIVTVAYNSHVISYNIMAFHNIIHANMQYRDCKAIDNPELFKVAKNLSPLKCREQSALKPVNSEQIKFNFLLSTTHCVFLPDLWRIWDKKRSILHKWRQ